MMILRELGVDVLSAARQRIINVFENGLPVYLSFSGGKDSLVLAHITLSLGLQGLIDFNRLRIEFIDEEGIFICVERTVMEWRDKFLSLGCRFDWYCLEVRHYSCLNMLENDESFICWDRYKSDTWIRQPPPFAIRSHPKLHPRLDTYQQFLERINDGVHITGVRIFESIQRRQAVARKYGSFTKGKTEPLYDWRDEDVWYYLHANNIEIPEAYMYLYQIGVPNNRLRISQFFSIDTAFTLSRMSEFYPDLMEAILRREPSAYIVSLYWDSEMFRRRTRKRHEMEGEDGENYREKVLDLLSNIPANFKSKSMIATAEEIRRKLIRYQGYLNDAAFRRAYDILRTGDPKKRSIRGLIFKIICDAADKNNIRTPSNITAGNKRKARGKGNGKAESIQPEYRTE